MTSLDSLPLLMRLLLTRPFPRTSQCRRWVASNIVDAAPTPLTTPGSRQPDIERSLILVLCVADLYAATCRSAQLSYKL